MSVRKAHNSGRNHERNVLDYYQRTALPQLLPDMYPLRSEGYPNGRSIEIGHEKAQSVIDSITSSYAAEGQAGANPMLNQGGGPMGGPGFPPPFGFPGRDFPSPYLPPNILFNLAPGKPKGTSPRCYNRNSANLHNYRRHSSAIRNAWSPPFRGSRWFPSSYDFSNPSLFSL